MKLPSPSSRHGAPRAIAPVLVALLVMSVAAIVPVLGGHAVAQSPPSGRISGTVDNGTAGAPAPDGAEVRLITLDGSTVVDSQSATVADGGFAFAVDPSPTFTHVLRVVYEDVPYFAEPILLTPDAATAERAVTVYEITSDPPNLTITVTTVTLVALDRATGEMTLLREDGVRNPSDRVYIGDADGVTFRVPAFDGVTDAGGLVDDGSVRYEAGLVTVAQPLLPGDTSIVTRYAVGYDRAADRYRLRATAPIPADRIEVRVPARFVLSFEPVDDTQRDGEDTLQGERVLVLARDHVEPGDGLLGDLVGLSGVARARNPLTEQPGAAIAAAIALVALVGGAVGTIMVARRRAGSAAS